MKPRCCAVGTSPWRLDAAQIEGLPVGVLDDEAEGLGIEGSATTKVGDTQGNLACCGRC